MPAKTPDRPRIFLNSVHLKGFKSIEDLSIDFQKGLNILIGKNGSGKSNFMEFIFLGILSNGDSNFRYNYVELDFISEDNHTFTIELKKELNRKNGQDDLEDRIRLSEKFIIDKKVAFDSEDKNLREAFVFKDKTISYGGKFRVLFRSLGYRADNPLFVKFSLPDSENLECISTPGSLNIDLDSPVLFSEHPKTLSFINKVFDKIEYLYEEEPQKAKAITKSNVLNELKLGEEIIDNLSLYTNITDVRFRSNINLYTTEQSIIIENIKLEFKVNSNWLPWSQLSDGTKRLFFIISEVTNSNGLILIEEPELGIHPHQFNLLMDFLKEQSEHKQIIISTHAPKALDHLTSDEFNSILITSYDLKKRTQMRHLTGKEVKKAKSYMKEVGFFSDYWLLSDLEE